MNWCKVDAALDTNPKIIKAGRLGREVFLFILRRIKIRDNDGWVPLDDIDPEYVARVLGMPVTEARDGVTAVRDASLVVVEGGKCAVSGWDEDWGKRPQTQAQRAAKYRNKEKNQPTVTERHDANVTRHASHAVEERRIEEKISLPTPRKRKAKTKREEIDCPPDWKPTESHLAKARELGLDCADQAERFRLRHGSKGTQFADWNLAFHTWLRNAKDFARGRGGGSPGSQGSLLTGEIAGTRQL